MAERVEPSRRLPERRSNDGHQQLPAAGDRHPLHHGPVQRHGECDRGDMARIGKNEWDNFPCAVAACMESCGTSSSSADSRPAIAYTANSSNSVASPGCKRWRASSPVTICEFESSQSDGGKVKMTRSTGCLTGFVMERARQSGARRVNLARVHHRTMTVS